MKIKKKYSELIIANIVMGEYLKKHVDKENKICASIKNFTKQLTQIFENYNDEKDTLQLNNCAVDEKTKVILKDEKGNRQFTVEGEIKLKGEIKELNKKEVEFHSRIAEGIEDLIAELTDEEKETFEGIVIPIKAEEIEG